MFASATVLTLHAANERLFIRIVRLPLLEQVKSGYRVIIEIIKQTLLTCCRRSLLLCSAVRPCIALRLLPRFLSWLLVCRL